MTPINFSFHWLDENGNAKGFLAKKGILDGETLKLDDTEIPVPAILEVETRNQILIFSLIGENDQPVHLGIQTSKAKKLKEEMGRLRSAVWAELHREKLEKEGQGHVFRQETCPSCAAVIDLTDMPETPQIHCHFCNTQSLIRPPITEDSMVEVKTDRGYQICDECGMFSKPREFSVFYFYFLLVVYGWRHYTTWRCPGCMRSEAWKMLMGNFLFVLGVPFALVQLFRAYGGADMGGSFSGLDNANIMARKGNLEKAIATYREILNRRPVTAGVKYNIGLALLSQKRIGDAAKIFESALADCANYRPAATLLAGCYEELGETQKLADLKAQWGVDEEEEDEQATAESLPAPAGNDIFETD